MTNAANLANVAAITNATTTDLTVSGNLTVTGTTTLPGGTANGVAYLNGSKVLTTGSALTFDGSKLLVSSSGEQVKLLSSGDFTTTGTGYIRWYDSVGAQGYIGYAGTANRFDLQTGTGMNLNLNAVGGTTTFAVSNSEQMRLTSTGLGIGTSSPASKLDVNGLTNTNGLTTRGVVTIQSTAYFIGNASYGYRFNNAADTLNLMILNDSGNLGLGVTPSTWSSNRLALQIGGSSGGYVIANSGLAVGSNLYFNSGDKFVGNGYAPLYYMSPGSGQHQWYITQNNASGAGAAVSFTQAMTLDASGRLAVGTTSPTTGGFNPTIAAKSFTDSIGGGIMVEGSGADATLNMGYDGASMFISSSYRTSSGYKPIAFYTSGSERARIDTSGNLLVGITSNSWGARLVSQNSSQAAQFNTTNSATTVVVGLDCSANNTTQRAINVYSSSNVADNFIVYSNGNVVNRNNSYGPISDVKLKENIVDATPKLDGLMQVRIVNYNLIGETQKQIGVIAQELEQVFPGLVDAHPDMDEEGNNLGTTTKSVKMSVFVPMLIKAIQEQQALITQLNARITALEGK